MRKARLPLTLCFAVLVVACTTTKDLEMHPEVVPAGSPRTEEKESALQRSPSSESGQGDSSALVDGGATKEAQPPSTAAQGTADAASANGAQPGEGSSAAPPVVVEKKIYIEKPIYFPESAGSEQTNPADAVASATSQGVTKPRAYNGAVMLYDYDQMFVYQVYAMPLRVTDIYLEPGEKVIEQPFCGDTTRWNIGGGISKTAGVDTQHLYLKPSEEGLETTLIINTDRRIYHLIIKSFKDTFMLAVMWRYPGFPGAGMPQDFLSSDGQQKKGASRANRQGRDESEGQEVAFVVDPSLVSSDYTVSYPKGNPPQWLPTLVIDDGEKTYIVLPDTVIHHELPAVFGENGELVNFRVKDNLVVIDRLMKRIQLKLRDVTVEIRKKGA